ncbi:peptidase S41 [Turneriella parva DSM 21527]|uniref:Peptidase S41 n=2 Tax=Turneriella TaxID=338321 RepID=I4B753_TURPD|nr:peptidase S41 [Turneriella parva DSM 21527]
MKQMRAIGYHVQRGARTAARLLAFAASFAVLYAARGDTNRGQGISATAAQSDFKIMNKIFAEAHATAFRQTGTAEPPVLFDEKKKVSIRDFVLRVLEHYRGLHVDHTGLGFSPELIEELGLKTALFPFPLKFIEGRAFADCEYLELRPGSEILQINGKPMLEILQKLEMAAGIKDPEGRWADYRIGEGFSFIYYMANGAASEWKIQYKSGNRQKEIVVNTAAAEPSPFVPRKSALKAQHSQPLFTMFNPSLKAAYLAINTFMPTGNQLDTIESWHNHLNLLHQESRAKGVENLVIDLRTNRGGVMLFSAAAATWFITKPVGDRSRSSARSRILPYKQYAQAINGMASTEAMLRDTENHLQKSFADKMKDGYFETRATEARFLELTPIEQAHAFKKIYILTGPATYSAAVNFARLVRLGNENAVIVGEETGSPGDGHSAEILLTYKLPASGLLFEIPLVKVAFAPLVAGQKPGRGLKPDITVVETAADFVAGKDTGLNAVSDLMDKK